MGQQAFPGVSRYVIDVDAAMISQNVPGNYSTIYWRIYVMASYGGHWASTNMGNSGSASSNVGGLWSNGNMAYDFRSGTQWLIAEGTFNVGHRSDGNAEYQVSGALNLYALGYAEATTGVRSLPRINRATVPGAPTSLGADQATQTSIRYRFAGTTDGGSGILEWQIGYGIDPGTAQFFTGSGGNTTIGGLSPGKTWYFWSRGRNAVGWGPWSGRASTRTIAGARVKVGGVWKEAIPYVKVGGVWKLAQPFVKVSGTWKKSS